MERIQKLLLLLLAFLIVLSVVVWGLVLFPSAQDLFFKNSSSFSVVVLPDIQNYSQKGNEEILFSQVNWIVANKDKKNIVFVIFEGDLVNKWNDGGQWGDANKAVSILESAGVAFELTLGNHDHNSNKPSLNAPLFEEYFPEGRFKDNAWWGGSFERYNSYQVLKVSGKDFLFLGLDFCPSKEEVEWADKIFSENAGKQLVLTTHGYLGLDANRKVHNCGSTEYIWEMAKKHSNLRIILSGHVHGEALLVSKNDFGKEVYQMLADYQDYSDGGGGYLRVLDFFPSEGKLRVSTYSPFLNNFDIDSSSSFEFEYFN